MVTFSLLADLFVFSVINKLFLWMFDIKGVYLSKDLTCMKFFLYKWMFDIKGIYLSKDLTCIHFSCKNVFYQGGGHLWPHCCVNNLYISHRSLYALTYSLNGIKPGSNSKKTDKHASDCSKTVCWDVK